MFTSTKLTKHVPSFFSLPGQATLLGALGPLFHARHFVLVGDPQQLPPVVQSERARAGGLDASLFSHLETPDNTIPLNIQYRMNQELMDCANKMTYGGRLEGGSEEVLGRVLRHSEEAENLDPVMARVVSSRMEDSLLFLDTSGVAEASEVTSDKGVTNPAEAKMVKAIYEKLRKQGSVGVIAPYRAQVRQRQTIFSVCSMLCVQFIPNKLLLIRNFYSFSDGPLAPQPGQHD